MTAYAIVMAGGTGTRFWPASRVRRPKQFLPIANNSPMITQTVDRLEGIVPLEQTMVVTAQDQAHWVRETLPELPVENILCEPQPRNTAACLAYASYVIAKQAPDAVQLVLPADHVIQPKEAFQQTAKLAVEAAQTTPNLYTFGIRPTYPATGYGYIEIASGLGSGEGGMFEVVRFVEKPDLDRAREFVARGTFLWNSGMFVWNTRAIQRAFRDHLPGMLESFDRLDQGTALSDLYPDLPSVPIDVGVMEKADNVLVLPIDYGWNDVGSWEAVSEVRSADSSGNFSILGDTTRLISESSDGCVVYALGDELIGLVGVQDLVVVRDGNATLVCPRERSQDVKKLVDRLKDEAPDFL